MFTYLEKIFLQPTVYIRMQVSTVGWLVFLLQIVGSFMIFVGVFAVIGYIGYRLSKRYDSFHTGDLPDNW